MFQHPCPRKTGCLICALQLVHEVKWFVYSLNTDWASNLLPDFLKEVLQQETILSYAPTMVLLNPANPRMKNWSLQEIEGTGWAHKSVKPLFIVSNSSSLVQWLSESFFFFPFSIFFSHLLNPCSFTYNILRQAVNSQPNKYLHLVQTCYLPFPWFPWIRILKNLFLCYLLRATPFTHFYLVSCQVVIFFFKVKN